MRVITNREVFYNVISDEGKDAIATGVAAVTTLGSAALSRPKTFTEVEQKCGKRPKIGKKRKAEWQKCAASISSQTVQGSQGGQTTQLGQVNDKKPMSKNLKMGLIIGSSLLVVAVIGFVIYKRRKK